METPPRSEKYPSDIIETVAKGIAGHVGDLGKSRNLGYYRTEFDCSCGETFWFGEHEGDPTLEQVWGEHLAIAALDALGLTVEYGTAIKEPDGTLWDHYANGNTLENIRAAIADDDRPIALIWRVAETPWVEVADDAE